MHADGPRLNEETDGQQDKERAAIATGCEQGCKCGASRHGVSHGETGDKNIARGNGEEQIAKGIRNGLTPPRNQEIRRKGHELEEIEELEAGRGTRQCDQRKQHQGEQGMEAWSWIGAIETGDRQCKAPCVEEPGEQEADAG